MSDKEFHKKNKVYINKIANGYTLEIWLKGEEQDFGSGKEVFYQNIDEALAEMKRILES